MTKVIFQGHRRQLLLASKLVVILTTRISYLYVIHLHPLPAPQACYIEYEAAYAWTQIAACTKTCPPRFPHRSRLGVHLRTASSTYRSFTTIRARSCRSRAAVPRNFLFPSAPPPMGTKLLAGSRTPEVREADG